jgi:hypothetical protein
MMRKPAMALIDGESQVGPLVRVIMQTGFSMRITGRPEAHVTCDRGCGTVLSDYACSLEWICFQALRGCFWRAHCHCAANSSPQIITSGS